MQGRPGAVAADCMSGSDVCMLFTMLLERHRKAGKTVHVVYDGLELESALHENNLRLKSACLSGMGCARWGCINKSTK